MENTKKNGQKKTYFATLWRGLHRENQKHPEKTKEKQNKQKKTKNPKIQNYRPHGTPCHKSPDMRCIVLDFWDFFQFLPHWMLSLSHVMVSSLCILACSNNAQPKKKRLRDFYNGVRAC
jgi:hypothetical protein